MRHPGAADVPRGQDAMLTTLSLGRVVIDGSEPSGVVVYPLIVLSALAMGVQSAAVRRLAVADVATTYITGTLTGLTARMVR